MSSAGQQHRSLFTTTFVRVTIATAIVLGSLGLASIDARPSLACSPSPGLQAGIDELSVGGTAGLQQSFETIWDEAIQYGYDTTRKDGDVPTVIGAYERETIASFDPTEDWSRGSVSVVRRSWGELGDTETVQIHHDTSNRTGDDCGNRNGNSFGTVDHYLVTSDLTYEMTGRPIAPGLDSLFGEAVEVERDSDAEEAASARIQAERDGKTSTSSVNMFAPIALLGAAALVFGRVWMRRRHRVINKAG